MRITLEIPDDLYREARDRAEREHRKIEHFVSAGLRIVLGLASAPKRRLPKRMMKPPVTIREGNEIPALTNNAMAKLLHRDGEGRGL
jgi:hypothetical protein